MSGNDFKSICGELDRSIVMGDGNSLYVLINQGPKINSIAKLSLIGPAKPLSDDEALLGEMASCFIQSTEVYNATGLGPRELADKADAGEKFKAFVHAYLDQHDVPYGDPANQHQIEGCRIGARLDLLFARLQAFEKMFAVDMDVNELAALQKDAERWRKFKSNPFGNDAKFGDELDAMIDSMEATQQ